MPPSRQLKCFWHSVLTVVLPPSHSRQGPSFLHVVSAVTCKDRQIRRAIAICSCNMVECMLTCSKSETSSDSTAALNPENDCHGAYGVPECSRAETFAAPTRCRRLEHPSPRALLSIRRWILSQILFPGSYIKIGRISILVSKLKGTQRPSLRYVRNGLSRRFGVRVAVECQ
jgi:hypothetical protein